MAPFQDCVERRKDEEKTVEMVDDEEEGEMSWDFSHAITLYPLLWN